MTNEEIRDKLNELGIVSIKTSGAFSLGLVKDAIASTEILMASLNIPIHL